VLLAAILASNLAGGRSHVAATAVRADASGSAVGASASPSPPAAPASAGAGPVSCPLAVSPKGYVNPLAAIGSAQITYVATTDTGWPGAYIEYRLLDGADAGCYVFYAEGVVPIDGLHVGQMIAAGQPIATIIPKYPTGIEIGWASGIATKAYAKVAGQWSATDDQDNVATAAGKDFSALIAALGGPPGKVEG
jgi:hypothetical protein